MVESMTKNIEWSETLENGITLGPEETLLREIEKNKALKVEKLGLQDKVSKLQSENSYLANKNKKLNYRLRKLIPLSHKRVRQNLNFKENLKRFTSLLIRITAILTFVLLFFIFF